MEYSHIIGLQHAKLVATVADFDDELAELFILEEPIEPEVLQAAIRRTTLELKFSPGQQPRF